MTKAGMTMTLNPEFLKELDEVLDTFQWAYPDLGDNRGEVSREGESLVLSVWALDTDDPEAEELSPLRGEMPIDDTMDPKELVREFIHLYVTHEADEQMYFGDAGRIFHPHVGAR